MPRQRKASETDCGTDISRSEKDFCISYLQSFNPMSAAINAGHKPHVAKQAGLELLQDPRIIGEMKRLQSAKRSGLLVTPDDVLERQMQIAFSDITDFVDFGTEQVEVLDKKTNEMTTRTVNTVYLKDSKDVDGGIIGEVWRTTDGAARIKLADRQRALEWLARYFNMYPMDQHRVEYDEMRLKLAGAGKESDGNPVEIRFIGKEEPVDGYGYMDGERFDDCFDTDGYETDWETDDGQAQQ